MAADQLTPKPNSRAEYQRAWRLANPGYAAARQAEWRKANPDVAKARVKAYDEAHRSQKSDYNAEYRERHASKISQRKREQKDRPAFRMQLLVGDAKHRAKKRGLEFDGLCHLPGTMPSACACCGVTMDYARGRGRSPLYSPSLDRVDSSRGYTVENVRVICLRCNQLKNNATADELEKIVAYMRS